MLRFRTIMVIACSVSLFLILSGVTNKGYGNGKSGEALFKQHCEMCHPNGGNIVNPKRTLSKKDREANGVKSKDDIVHFMRKPGPGMTAFDEKVLPEKAAKEIAEYIQKTFK